MPLLFCTVWIRRYEVKLRDLARSVEAVTSRQFGISARLLRLRLKDTVIHRECTTESRSEGETGDRKN